MPADGWLTTGTAGKAVLPTSDRAETNARVPLIITVTSPLRGGLVARQAR